MTGNENIFSPEELLASTRWMKALALSLVHDEGLADDLVQETLRISLEHPPRHREAGDFWLRKVLRNLAFRSRRRTYRRLQCEKNAARPEAVMATPEKLLERVELQHQIVKLVLDLDEPFRTTVLMRFFEDLDCKEVADRQGVDATTVRWRLRKALGQLRQRLDASHGSRKEWCAILLPLLGGKVLEQVTSTVTGAAARSASGAASSPVRAALGLNGYYLFGVAVMKLKSAIVLGAILLVAIGFAFRFLPGSHSGAPETVAVLPIPEREKVPPRNPTGEKASPAAPAPAAGIVTETVQATGISIGGIVTDEVSGEAIPDATVKIRGLNLKATTSTEGKYSLDELPPGEHFLVASAKGHAEWHAKLGILEKGEYRQDFHLSPAIELQVLVVDPKDVPIEDVEVTPCQPARDYVYSDEYTRRTDSEGMATIPSISKLRPQQINARKKGYKEVWTQSYNVDPEKDTADLKIILEDLPVGDCVVTGRVTDPMNQLLGGINVQWIHSWGEHKGRVVVTSDAKGSYRLTFPRESERCRISAFGEGWAPVISQAIKPGTQEEPAEVNFTMEKGHWLEGQVVDEEDRPVEGAAVKAMPSLDSLRNVPLYPGNLKAAKTAADGAFILLDLSGPNVAIKLDGPQGGAWAHNYIEVVDVDQKVRFTLKRFGVLRGRVVDDETGEPVANFIMKLKGGYYDYPRCNPGESFNSPDGRFALKDLDPPKVVIVIEAEGYITAQFEEDVTSPEDEEQEVEIRLWRKDRPLEGMVVDADSMMPVSEVMVITGFSKSDNTVWSIGDLRNKEEHLTDNYGLFRFLESEPGCILLQKDGFCRLSIQPEERDRFLDPSGRLRIPIRRGITLSGVMYRNGKPSPNDSLFLSFTGSPTEPAGESGNEPEEVVWRNSIQNQQVKADSESKFLVNGLPPGHYRAYQAYAMPECEEVRFNIRCQFEVGRGKDPVLDYGKDLGSLSLQGRLLDQKGLTIKSAIVGLFPEFDWQYIFTAYVTPAQEGKFYLSGMRQGKYRVMVSITAEEEVIPMPSIDLKASMEKDLVIPHRDK